ncbi:hypothetical protein GCM10011579_029560 [Streptomyces albiflavescens]|uniref:Uncharacterized protein n=1 Tax=Streptomyces albiflavescens TaxID=1623582 RepID=A0A917Y1I6_9ACTN|nr:hypothetical protein GCM10011579_029560 [Streptomyces albiflavescens]
MMRAGLTKCYAAELLDEPVPDDFESEEDEDVDDEDVDDEDVDDEDVDDEEEVDGFADAGELLDEEPRLSLR